MSFVLDHVRDHQRRLSGNLARELDRFFEVCRLLLRDRSIHPVLQNLPIGFHFFAFLLDVEDHPPKFLGE